MYIHEIYSLNKNISDEKLKENGFKNGTYKCFIFKDIIQLIVKIDIAEKWWDFHVYDVNNHISYRQFYDRKYGTNDIIKKLDNKIKAIFDEMTKQNILSKKG